MIGGIKIKVCGLTRASDADAASLIGVDFLGFIFYPKSPRYLDYEAYQKLKSQLPHLPKVAVVVMPDSEQLARLEDLEFDFFQIHFPSADTPPEELSRWSERLTPEKLWLAPKISPGETVDKRILSFASTWLWDTYQKDAFGGTGRVGDWKGFKQIARRYPAKKWMLAGGLSPENVADAVSRTEAHRIDLNSGVEKSPGIKDQRKLEQVRIALENR